MDAAIEHSNKYIMPDGWQMELIKSEKQGRKLSTILFKYKDGSKVEMLMLYQAMLCDALGRMLGYFDGTAAAEVILALTIPNNVFMSDMAAIRTMFSCAHKFTVARRILSAYAQNRAIKKTDLDTKGIEINNVRNIALFREADAATISALNYVLREFEMPRQYITNLNHGQFILLVTVDVGGSTANVSASLVERSDNDLNVSFVYNDKGMLGGLRIDNILAEAAQAKWTGANGQQLVPENQTSPWEPFKSGWHQYISDKFGDNGQYWSTFRAQSKAFDAYVSEANDLAVRFAKACAFFIQRSQHIVLVKCGQSSNSNAVMSLFKDVIPNAFNNKVTSVTMGK